MLQTDKPVFVQAYTQGPSVEGLDVSVRIGLSGSYVQHPAGRAAYDVDATLCGDGSIHHHPARLNRLAGPSRAEHWVCDTARRVEVPKIEAST
jgi:hypothetical protein